VEWIDERESEFPAGPLPEHIRRVCVEPVEAEVPLAAPGTFYLVLTHNHDLDLRLAHAMRAEGLYSIMPTEDLFIVLAGCAKLLICESSFQNQKLLNSAAPAYTQGRLEFLMRSSAQVVSLDEALAYVNDHDRPLGLYYFGDDPAEREEVLNRTTAGGVTVNDVIMHVAQEDLPFGGVGPSGMGSYHGVDGFREFSHRKAIFSQMKNDIGPLKMLRPPYGPGIRKMLDGQIKA
jgi:hypothetical protein